MTTNFSPSAIRAGASGYQERRQAAIASAANGVTTCQDIKLPRCAASQEGELNGLLARMPKALSMLSAMASSFEAKSLGAADAYQAREESNTDLGANATGEL